jgi:DNA topoisomerase-3
VDPEPTVNSSGNDARPPSELTKLLGRFGHERFRPYQEPVCRAAALGHDLLLVMPTGAGKSLCYQLPGLARGGTTLVVSPLIALMEDQVGKLGARGFAAERIHSGRDRSESRRVSFDYLEGRLDYLFIAPERLRVPGFPEMLAKRRPALVAVDEAHCISHWGHDFRPDYRLLGERLPLLRPAPIVAMTATATPRVQDDILEQLGMRHARRFIHGFRRTNLAIEVVEASPAERSGIVAGLLADGARRPAIVYAPTRKQAEAQAAELALHFPTESYHAGMAAARRDEVQASFLVGKLEVIVATVAFGMGVDKPDVRTVVHTALPASLEGYYQEVGRAGRDGLPSRGVLLHSYADRRTLEYLLDLSYPPPGPLALLFRRLPEEPVPRHELPERLGMSEQELEPMLDRLRVHGGAQVQGHRVRRGSDRWLRAYEAQREHRLAQLEEVQRFTQAHACRMLELVRHFGDQEDEGAPCGLCDICAPQDSAVLEFRPARERERRVLRAVVERLRRQAGATPAQLLRQVSSGDLTRDDLESLLGALARAGHVAEHAQSFEKDGRRIDYKRFTLTPKGRAATDVEDALVAVERPARARRTRRGR